MSEELARLLATPPQPSVTPFKVPAAWTPRREVGLDDATIVTAPTGADIDTETVIRDAGLDPAEWEVVTYRKSEWETRPDEWLTSHRLNLKPRSRAQGVDLEDLLERVRTSGPRSPQDTGTTRAYVHATGDWQLGKIDGDGPGGTVDRIMAGIDLSVQRWENLGWRPAVHLAFLGDCLEGFVSQGGANTWRTSLTLTEQLRLVRRLMLAHVQAFAPEVDKLTVVSIPGNHDEAVRIGGKGVTRFDDSLAVEALHAVADACATNPAAYGHVEFYTPARDSLTVTTQVAGTTITHAHGHAWRHGKHFEWLDAMAGNRQPEGEADLLLAGHSHHLFVQERGPRTYLQVPAMESESTWWKNRTGQGGAPGVLTFTTENGRVYDMEVLR